MHFKSSASREARQVPCMVADAGERALGQQEHDIHVAAEQPTEARMGSEADREVMRRGGGTRLSPRNGNGASIQRTVSESKNAI